MNVLSKHFQSTLSFIRPTNQTTVEILHIEHKAYTQIFITSRLGKKLSKRQDIWIEMIINDYGKQRCIKIRRNSLWKSQECLQGKEKISGDE